MLHRPLYRFLGKFLKKNDRRQLATKKLLSEDFDYSIRHAKYVNSRSILFACDIHPSNPKSSIADTAYLDGIKEKLVEFQRGGNHRNPSIYVPSDGLVYFAEYILEKLDVPFILVSGDSDLPINQNTLGINLEKLLVNEKLIRWYAQNRNFNHAKLFSLPIGINIHNLWSNPLEWGGGFILPAMQELQIATISEQAKNFELRNKKIFCNWHFSIDRSNRKECFAKIDHSICYFQEQPTPVAQTWELQSQFQFVLSPHGAGLDCHRTWEALILGCIPVIQSSSIDDLFTELPVIIINDWEEIGPGFFEKAASQLNGKKINAEKLYMNYWRSAIRG